MVLLVSGHPYVLFDHRTTKALVEEYLLSQRRKITTNIQLNEYQIYCLSTARCYAGAPGPTSVRLKGQARLPQTMLEGAFHTQETPLADKRQLHPVSHYPPR